MWRKSQAEAQLPLLGRQALILRDFSFWEGQPLMLLNSFHITHILPCLADPEKIRTIAELSDDAGYNVPSVFSDAERGEFRI